MLLGEYQDERAEVVLRKALPSKRAARAQLNRSKPPNSYAAKSKAGNKGRRKGKKKSDTASMGSHHSTVQPGYSYSPRRAGQTNLPVQPAGVLPSHLQQPYNIGINGYFSSQSPPQPNLAMGNSGFQGAVYYNEGSPVAVFAGEEASRNFPQYYSNSFNNR